MPFYLIIGLLVGISVVIFIIQNTTPIIVHFLIWNLTGSLALIILLTFVVGIITSILVAIPLFFTRRKKSSSEKNK